MSWGAAGVALGSAGITGAAGAAAGAADMTWGADDGDITGMPAGKTGWSSLMAGIGSGALGLGGASAVVDCVGLVVG